MLLSNKVGDMELNHRAIITMGDSLGELRPRCYVHPFLGAAQLAALLEMPGISMRA